MGDERFFRTVAAALLISAMSISGYHRHRAERAGEVRNPSWREEGLPIAVGMRWSSMELPAPLRWLGAVLGAASLPLSYWVLSSIGENITPSVSTRKNHKLVTSGPYRRVRHPLYSVGASFAVSLTLLAANWFMGLVSATGLVLLLIRLPKEEEKLIERFGDEYRAYAERTGRFLPRFK